MSQLLGVICCHRHYGCCPFICCKFDADLICWGFICLKVQVLLMCYFLQTVTVLWRKWMTCSSSIVVSMRRDPSLTSTTFLDICSAILVGCLGWSPTCCVYSRVQAFVRPKPSASGFSAATPSKCLTRVHLLRCRYRLGPPWTAKYRNLMDAKLIVSSQQLLWYVQSAITAHRAAAVS